MIIKKIQKKEQVSLKNQSPWKETKPNQKLPMEKEKEKHHDKIWIGLLFWFFWTEKEEGSLCIMYLFTNP